MPFPGPHVAACPSEECNFPEKLHSAQDNRFYFLKTTLASEFLFYTMLNFSPFKVLLSGVSPTPWSHKEQVYFLSHMRTVIMPPPLPHVFSLILTKHPHFPL